MKSVEVEVPASAANLGPGFDCLALALSLVNRFTFSLIEGELDISYEGIAGERIPQDESNLAVASFMRLADISQAGYPGLKLMAETQVPPASGLGSSSTAVIAGLLAADYLLKLDLSQSELLSVAAQIEGHADNAAAALHGGLVSVRKSAAVWHVQKLPLAQQQLVVVIPQVDISTERMRSVLPDSIDRDQAVANAASLIFMVHGLASADYAQIRSASQVSFHQPARLAQIPGGVEAMQAGRAAGAAVMLAGAGPGLIAFAPDNHQLIATAIQDAFKRVQVEASIRYLETRMQGAVIRQAD